MHTTSSEDDSIPIFRETKCRINVNQYQSQYKKSVETNEEYWAARAKLLDWHKFFTITKNVSFTKQDFRVRWFEDGELNVCVNCVDRHLPMRAMETAIIVEQDNMDYARHISYQELHKEVCRLANALEKIGIASGDRVILYMPMIPETVFAMLACARIGAIHSVVFAGFSANALAERIKDCTAKLVITTAKGHRGEKEIPLKENVDEALEEAGTESVNHVVVVDGLDSTVGWNSDRDITYDQLILGADTSHHAKFFPAEHPLFILYTSGSTGKPKGLQHSSAGYLLYVVSTFLDVFDYQNGDIYWCTADVGWITGHSYTVYGPLAAGASSVIYEGALNYPDWGRLGSVIDKHNVSLFYTAPTTIRMLMNNSDAALNFSSRKSLRLLGSVGETITPDVWQWYYQYFGLGAPVVDTWWQTETGGHMISPLPGATSLKPGAAGLPYFGIQPAIVNQEGDLLDGEASGFLVILDSWPGLARTIWGNHLAFINTYFSPFEGMYFTGDGARRDQDGYYWITGRADDVLNVSGHRLGTAEIEFALLSHEHVLEAAVVGSPHDIKGEAIYAFVMASENIKPSKEITLDLIGHVRKTLGAFAAPDFVQWTSGLPKTRSGKVMRRILRKIAQNDFTNLGDISTLSEPGVVDSLIEGRLNR